MKNLQPARNNNFADIPKPRNAEKLWLCEIAGQRIPQDDARPETNEDAGIYDAQKAYAAVLDGVSGEKKDGRGRAASRVAVDAVEAALDKCPDNLSLPELKEYINSLIQKTDEKLFLARQKHPEALGSTTLALLKICDSPTGKPVGIVGNVGDSRVYLYRADKNTLSQLTLDHSLMRGNVGDAEAEKMQRLFNNLHDPAALSEQERHWWNRRNILSQAIGEGNLRPDITALELQKNDVLMLCSDGVSDNLENSKIKKILKTNPSPEKAVKALLTEAERESRNPKNPRRKPDDMVAIIVKIGKK